VRQHPLYGRVSKQCRIVPALFGRGTMDFPITLLKLAGSVALLLWGVHMVQSGVQRVFGAKLRGLLSRALRNRFKAFLAGLGVTAILQSSTATGLMVTGFAAGGLMDLVPALAVMLGANVGTTLIVQLLSFDVAEVAPALILIGVLMFRRAAAAPRDFGRVFIGLGLMLILVVNSGAQPDQATICRAANCEMRVFAERVSLYHSATLTRLTATAVMTCCKRVFANPM